ncbi:pyridine nucleotide-disulfide oxidoreductase, partial [Acinetobacter baumannii]
MNARKLALLLILLALVGAFFVFDLGRFFDLAWFKAQQQMLNERVAAAPWAAAAIYFVVYVAVTALSLPGAAVMTLAGGALFGF